MTSQIVLLNGLGVALASDSAVTAGNRVMHSSEKIFDLPTPHKVAVLDSGAARFMGYPWEVLLAAWAETIPKPLQTIEDYGTSFLKWLRSQIPSSPELSDEEGAFLDRIITGTDTGVLRNTYFGIKNLVRDLLDERLTQQEIETLGEIAWTESFRALVESRMNKDDLEKINAYLDEVITNQESYKLCDDISEAHARIWVTKFLETEQTYNGETKSLFDFWTNDLPLVEVYKEQLIKICCLGITNINYRLRTNLVIAGFGEADLFPAYWKVDIYGVIEGQIIKKYEHISKPTAEARYLPLGQTDAIDQLIDGYDWLVKDAANTHHKQSLFNVLKSVPDSDDPAIVELRQSLELMIQNDDIGKTLQDTGEQNRSGPFKHAINMSPLANLAEYAGQLVGVQSAHAAMTQDIPTVGGPIDVAVITRRHGFEWIRHKSLML